jgi:malonyl-CoA O-methyltransferase
MSKRQIINRNFSRYAKSYDAYAKVQNHSGLRLIDFAGTKIFKKILDIGCGTGNFTQLLRKKFPKALIKAFDISGEMAAVAAEKLKDKRIDFFVADAEKISLKEDFDLISSNACFQWFEDFDKAIGNYKDILTDGGNMVFTTFGPGTFCELGWALEKLYSNEIQISSAAFADKTKVEKTLQRYFSGPSVREEIVKENYSSLQELLNTIKYTGTRGLGLNGQALGKDRIKELEKVYKDKFGAITASYQIFYCSAVKER